MRLTLHTDYALRTLIFLACNPTGKLTSIREIAETYAISENHLIKIVQKLGQGGFITTTRGRNGGLRLARPAETIRIGDVVRFIEKERDFLSCQGNPDKDCSCRLMPACRVRQTMEKAMLAFLSVLDGTTLTDISTAEEKLALGM